MRIASIILASYIGFLTVQPMVSPVSGCEMKVEQKKSHSCCEKSEAKGCEKQEAGKCPSNGVCNPFCQCTCCLAAPEPSFFKFNQSISVIDFNLLESANLLSNYQADCFHPPEV